MKDQVPLRDDDVLLLRERSTFDPDELSRAVKPLGFKVFHSTRFAIVERELKKLIAEKGVSYVWRLARFREAVLPPGPAQRPGLLRMLDLMLAKLAPTSGFIIVDPYFLPTKAPATYRSEVLSLVEPIARRVAKIVLVTRPGHDTILLQGLQNALSASCPSCLIVHRTSDRYHDRFWIADETRGLFVGTSLNGIGRRYALADFMENTDVVQVIGDLRSNGLL